jgi:hypothetical protein
MKLTVAQVDAIQQNIALSGLTIGTLKDDVIDHLCCVVEEKLNQGIDFEKAFHEALNELAPNGLAEIEDETVFLLNTNKIIMMKKLMYSIGLIAAVSISMGTCFKFLHMPGAEQLLNYGYAGFVLLYLPMMLFDHFKTKIQSALSEKLKMILGFLSALFTAAAMLFKALHYPGAPELLLIGAVIFSFGFLPFLFFTMYKKSVA